MLQKNLNIEAKTHPKTSFISTLTRFFAT